ncbi:MAG: hypothetical protein Q8N16_03710 [bacterium]|nr:hypothetical protein [bacterium]
MAGGTVPKPVPIKTPPAGKPPSSGMEKPGAPAPDNIPSPEIEKPGGPRAESPSSTEEKAEKDFGSEKIEREETTERTEEEEGEEEGEEEDDDDDEEEEESDEETETSTGSKYLELLTPWGIFLIGTALIIDFAGILFTVLDVAYGLGEIFSWISDIVGLIVIGGLIMLRAMIMGKQFSSEEYAEGVVEQHAQRKQAVEAIGKKTKQAAAKAAKAAKAGGKAVKVGARVLRVVLAFIGEIVPLIGALPFWTISVYMELTSSPPSNE